MNNKPLRKFSKADELKQRARDIAASIPYDKDRFYIPCDFLREVMAELRECRDIAAIIRLLAGEGEE
ncbi:hypothetical protein KCT17_003682 [Escherichia coli]|nr:hypothetical protein [Escherichia coli]